MLDSTAKATALAQNIIFGSSSPFRRKILERLQWPIGQYISPDIDEKAIRSDCPRTLPMTIAIAKAEAVVKKAQDANIKGIIITADQVVVCNGEIREKPVSRDQAYEFLESYNQFPAETYSAVAVRNMYTDKIAVNVDYAAVKFKPFCSKELCFLIKQFYTMESAGAFVLGVETFDLHVDQIAGTRDSVVGLPIEMTKSLMKQTGYRQKLP